MPWPKPPFDFWLWVGWYYTTTFVPDNSLGFANMNGPQVYPSFTWTSRGGRHILGVYGKFSPVSENFVPTFKSYEFAGGVNYTLPPFFGNHRFGISTDLSWMSINIQDLLFIDSKSLSVSLTYGFTLID